MNVQLGLFIFIFFMIKTNNNKKTFPLRFLDKSHPGYRVIYSSVSTVIRTYLFWFLVQHQMCLSTLA